MSVHSSIRMTKQTLYVWHGLLSYIETQENFPSYRDLSKHIGRGIATIHHHVSRLRKAELVDPRRLPGLRPVGAKIVLPGHIERTLQ